MNKRLRSFFCINSNDNFSNQILIFHLAARIFLFFVFLQFYTRPVPQSEILMNISIRTKERHWEHCNSCISIGITFKLLTYLMVQVCRVDTMACSCFPEDNGLGKRGSAEHIQHYDCSESNGRSLRLSDQSSVNHPTLIGSGCTYTAT